jgi:hypothetical protein
MCGWGVKGQEPASSLQPVKLGENVNVKFGGFARVDYFVDSRKGREAVDGFFYLWPDAVKNDANGKDLNKKVNQNLSAIPTRFSSLFGGPEAFKAKASAYFEFDFTGGNSNYLLFRQGWVKLDWAKSSLQIGRLWHPLQGPVVPSTVALNYAAPYNVFCRGEQVRFTYKPGAVTFLAAAFMQSGHASFGPNATTGEPEQSFRFMRMSMIPDMNFQVHYTSGNFTTGLMSQFKSLQPREYTTVNNVNYQTTERVNSYALAAFGQYKKGLFVAKGNAMYGQNLAEMSMQGGYARVKIDPSTGHESYATASAITSWVNLSYGDKVRVGVLGGYQKNLGFSEDLDQAAYKFYGRGDNVASIVRITPTFSVYSGRMAFQSEVEITSAAYGQIDYSDKGKVKDTESVTNCRIYMAISYFF